MWVSRDRRVFGPGVVPERAFGPASAAARASFEESGTGARRGRGRRQGLDGIGAENDYFTDRARCRSGDRDQARPGAGAGARWRGCGRGVGAVGAGDHFYARGYRMKRCPIRTSQRARRWRRVDGADAF